MRTSIIYSRIRLELLAVCMAEREKEAYKMKMEEQKKNSLRLRILLLSLLSFHIIYQCVKNSSSSSTIHFAVGTTLFSSELILKNVDEYIRVQSSIYTVRLSEI